MRNVIVDITNEDRDGHSGGFGLSSDRFLGRDGTIGPRQFLVVQHQMALDPDAENSLVDHDSGTDVKHIVCTLKSQVESSVLPL